MEMSTGQSISFHYCHQSLEKGFADKLILKLSFSSSTFAKNHITSDNPGFALAYGCSFLLYEIQALSEAGSWFCKQGMLF